VDNCPNRSPPPRAQKKSATDGLGWTFIRGGFKRIGKSCAEEGLCFQLERCPTPLVGEDEIGGGGADREGAREAVAHDTGEDHRHGGPQHRRLRLDPGGGTHPVGAGTKGTKRGMESLNF